MILTLENEMGAWFVSDKIRPMNDMYEVEDEKAKRWLHVQALWNEMQSEIEDEVKK